MHKASIQKFHSVYGHKLFSFLCCSASFALIMIQHIQRTEYTKLTSFLPHNWNLYISFIHIMFLNFNKKHSQEVVYNLTKNLSSHPLPVYALYWLGCFLFPSSCCQFLMLLILLHTSGGRLAAGTRSKQRTQECVWLYTSKSCCIWGLCEYN